MNIMFQCGSWHYDKGGTDLFVKTFSYWLARKGHKIVVLVHRLEEEKCQDEDIQLGKGIIKVRYTPSQRKGIRFNPFVYAYRLAITSYFMYRLAKSEQVNAIIVGEPELLAVLPLKLTKTKIILRGGALMYETLSKELDNEKPGLYSKLFKFIIKIYNNITLKLPDVMVPVNQAEYDFMNLKKKIKAVIETIPHGVDIDLFKPSNTKKEKIIVGYVGRLAPIKYPELALEIFKQASQDSKNTEFWWVGPLDPSYPKDFFEKLKLKMNLKNAKYLEKVDNNKLPKYLNKMSVFLQVEQQKNVSRSTTEAASCGLPVVALNQGKEEYGFFTSSKSKAIQELEKLIKNKPHRDLKSALARKIIEKHFSEDTIYSKFLSVLK
ncbi:MAG: glycosyltransferase [Candidatus Pacearchaeota archaeon]|nr:glycosyltransferase [Candidatus Pacearchaeota archaeon]